MCTICTMKTLYEYVTGISDTDKITFGLLIAVIVFAMNKLEISVTNIIGLGVALTVVYFWHERKKSAAENLYDALTAKISYLSNLTSQQLDYLYTDPEVINFYASVSYLHQYASDSFKRSLSLVNMFLHLKADVEIGTVRCDFDMDTAQDLSVNAMNAFSEIHFKLPDDMHIQTKHSSDNDYLQHKLLLLMQEMRMTCDKRVEDHLNIVPPTSSDFSGITLHVPYG